MYNTFETFKLGQAFELGSAAMREAIDSGRAMEFGGDVPNAADDDKMVQTGLRDDLA